MRGLDVQLLPRFSLDPATDTSAAGKDERVWSPIINDGQLKITLKWSCGYRFPFHKRFVAFHRRACFDLGHLCDTKFGNRCDRGPPRSIIF